VSCEVAETAASDGRVTVAITGEVDLAATALVTAAISRQLDREVTVDLQGVTFVDSWGLHCLLELRQEAARRGGRVIVGPVSATVERLLQLAGLQALLLGDRRDQP
jgi:anti-anti-sigma factor